MKDKQWGIDGKVIVKVTILPKEGVKLKVRTGHAPQNLSLLRRIALNALNLEQSFKRSNRQKSNRAAMDNNYMLTVLAACLSHHNDAKKPCCQ